MKLYNTERRRNMKTVIINGVTVDTYEDEAKHWKELYERESKENIKLRKLIHNLTKGVRDNG
jgi:hypothetical protein